jgi:LmbE family N-acetylglucosaminyl deacetylase
MRAGEVLDAAHSFPFRPLRQMLEDRPFIVVAPHPDDESLACGGLIADACRQGLPGKVVIVSDGAGSHPNSKAYPPDRLMALRKEEAKRAGSELGLKPEDMLFLNLPFCPF